MSELNIPNLRPVTLKEVEQKPIALTDDEIKQIVRYPGARRDIAAAHDVLLDIQRWCQFFADKGRNKDLIGVEDFRIAVIRTTNDGMNPDYADGGDTLVFVNKETGRGQAFDAAPPPGFGAQTYHYATANSLIQLAVKMRKDAE